jgi:NCS1 family nucleobase:cation symporter-1
VCSSDLGQYEYSRGIHWQAIVSLAAGAGVAFIGLFVPPLRVLYNYAWFVGFAVSFFAYLALTPKQVPILQAAD